MNIDDLAKTHQHDHTGYLLTDWYEAAFPAYSVFVQVQFVDRQELPYVDQFVLRTLETGLRTTADVGNVLGLDQPLVYATLERMDRLGCLIIAPGKGEQPETISLTPKGHKLLQEQVIQQPVRETIDFCIDALTGEYLVYRGLRTAKQLRESELHQIPTYTSRPQLEHLDLIAIRRLWNSTRRSLPKYAQSREIFDILSLEKSFAGYRVMRVLQFVRPSDGKLQVQVYDGSERSSSHEAVLLRMEGDHLRALRAEKRVGPEKIADPAEQLLDPQVYAAARQRAVELPRLEAEITQREQKIRSAEEQKRTSRTKEELAQASREVSELNVELAQLRARIDELTRSAPRTEVLPMAEHRPRLLQALRDAKQRVIIVSPWLTRKAVNTELREEIGHALARGVRVIIGYGFSPDADPEEERTLDRLDQLKRQRGGQNLLLERVGDSHAKVVVCDETYVITTSFNWLSFAGRSDWGNRVEFGTLTSDPAAVKQMLTQLGSLFRQIKL